ncbi:MAG: hypothetical protein KAJ14_04910 [Candidatus Omnitrophica bacterium]|jgi:hypothetical protein|nr:hypothetical protein [Candidatus Omnitrophota bacterium]
MKKMTIMSLVLNLILASLLFTPNFLALKQVHVNAKKLSEHRLSDPMPDVQMGVDLFTPMFP